MPPAVRCSDLARFADSDVVEYEYEYEYAYEYGYEYAYEYGYEYGSPYPRRAEMRAVAPSAGLE